MDNDESLIKELLKVPTESEWVEFKKNNSDPQEIGEYLSALSNSAALVGKAFAYLIWGIDDASKEISGTSFSPKSSKVGNEELESWLLRLLEPKLHFSFKFITLGETNIVVLEIPSAYKHPVRFSGQEYIRIGSYKKKLKDHPEIERRLWRIFDQTPFERKIAINNLQLEDVFSLLDINSYFLLLKKPNNLPEEETADILEKEDLIRKNDNGYWSITNLGAILFAKSLSDFNNLKRKAIRVIQYKGNSRLNTIREQIGIKGYASGFVGLIDYIDNIIPRHELIETALREDLPLYPIMSIRELAANALIHQDFFQTGTGPTIELFSDRLEITNPGTPLVEPKRFLDFPPKSRNEALASLMRRVGICEERGSGIDKVVSETEMYQLPPPLFTTTTNHTRAVLFSYKEFKDMDKEDRNRACYLHACLKYVNMEYMTNRSIRNRFGISESNSAMVSRIIKDAVEDGQIVKVSDPNSRRYSKYHPYWAI